MLCSSGWASWPDSVRKKESRKTRDLQRKHHSTLTMHFQAGPQFTDQFTDRDALQAISEPLVLFLLLIKWGFPLLSQSSQLCSVSAAGQWLAGKHVVPFPSGPSFPIPIFNACGNAASEVLGRKSAGQGRPSGEVSSSAALWSSFISNLKVTWNRCAHRLLPQPLAKSLFSQISCVLRMSGGKLPQIHYCKIQGPWSSTWMHWPTQDPRTGKSFYLSVSWLCHM